MQAGLLDTWKRPMRSRGAIAWVASLALITFYLLLYLPGSTFFPNFPDVLTPIATAMHLPSKWFLYGLLYSTAMVIGGFFMLRKHGNSRYHRIRTITVVAVQVVLAFSLPLALNIAGKPELYLTYVWPLSYDKLFPSTLAALPPAAALWFVFASLVLFPVLAFRYGKRFYCSWVCGCGGLAETFGDPWRHLSNRSTGAWRFEQWSIHGVLVLVLLTTGLVVADSVSRAGVVGDAGGPNGAAWTLSAALAKEAADLGDAAPPPPAAELREQAASVRARVEALDPPDWLREKLAPVEEAASRGAAAEQAQLVHDLAYNVVPTGPLDRAASSLKGAYAFFIGALFSGVAGVGLYPLMGTRVWCRFGCPMAAILGLVQKLGRFRIAVKKDMCISCGNCSAYCEMGIDVRAYAQANLDVRRASCVGCGMCAHVCPRGVLRLTNEADASPGVNAGQWVLDL